MSLDSEIITEFQSESRSLLGELLEIVDELEGGDGRPFKDLTAEFAQKIDRIMGAAKTLSMLDPEHVGLVTISKYAELCKGIGYRAAQAENPAVEPLVISFWADVLENLQTLLRTLSDKEKSAEASKGFSEVLNSRLEWIASKLPPLPK